MILSFTVLFPKTEHLDYFISQIDTFSTKAQKNHNEDIQFQLEYLVFDSFEDVASLRMNRFTKFVLDLTADWEITTQLQKMAKEREFVQVVMDSTLVSNVDEWSFPGKVHHQRVAEKTSAIIDWLNISKAGMSAEYTQNSGLLGKALSEISTAALSYTMSISNNYSAILNQVGRIVKPLGLTWQIVIGNGEEIELFIRAHAEKHILGKGRGFLLIGDRFPYLNDSDPEKVAKYSGFLYIIEDGLEAARNAAEISELRIVNTLLLIAESYKSCGLNLGVVTNITANCLKAYFKEQNYDTLETLVSEFSLFNSQNGQLVKICDISTELPVLENVKIVYPGNTETRPENDSASIDFIYLGGHLDNPLPFDSIAQAIHVGGQVAYAEISESELILPNYRFKSNLVEIGGWQLNMDEIGSFLPQVASLGHAYVGGFGYAFATAFDDLEKSNPEIVKPKLYSSVFHSNFTNPDTYPYFNRISISNRDLAVVFARMMALFNWRKFIYITSEFPELLDLQYQQSKVVSYGKFDPVLIENISSLADLSNFDEDYVDLIDRIIETNVRIIVALDYDQEKSFKIFESLYKRGYVPGDFIPVYNTEFNLAGLKAKYPENFENTMEFFHGAVSFSQNKFMGEIGGKLEIQYVEILGLDPPLVAGGCFEYDAMYTLAYAYDALLSRGQDYEIPKQLNDEIRSQRFTGCSGYIAFQIYTNDRTFPAYAVYQSQYQNGYLRQLQFGSYDPLSVNIASVSRNFFWADGSTGVPSDEFVESWDCPFADDEIETTPLGQNIAIGICCSIFGISIFIAIFIWRRFWNVHILPLTQREEFSQADLLLSVTLFIEFSQYITTGPDFSDYAYGPSVIANAISADIEEILDLKNGLFWILVNICMSLTGVIMILYLFNVTKIESRYPNVYEFQVFRKISDTILPFLDDILFLPIIQIYLEVFVCIETHGNDKYDMFLQQDCFVNCWTGTHLHYAIGTGCCLAVYIPVAIYLRPQWQENEHGLNVISEPFYLMVKSVFQIMIVALNKTLGRILPKRFGWLYIGVFFIYFIFLCKKKPFNYDRFCLWERISMLGVIWITIISVIRAQIEDKSHNTTLVTCLFVGWILLILGGWIIQFKYRDTLYPSLLYFHKTLDYADLIRFQFYNNIQTQRTLNRLQTKMEIQFKIRASIAQRAASAHDLHQRASSIGTSLNLSRNLTQGIKDIFSNYDIRSEDEYEIHEDIEQNCSIGNEEISERFEDPVAALNSFNDEFSYQSQIDINPQDGQCDEDGLFEESKTTNTNPSQLSQRKFKS